MPTYEYKCTECGHCFDVVHKVDENVEVCESCGSRVRRLFHPVGVIFKGSGFYSTDHRSSGSNGGKPASTGDTGGGDKQEGQQEGQQEGRKEEKSKPSDSAKPAPKSEPSQKTDKAGESESA